MSRTLSSLAFIQQVLPLRYWRLQHQFTSWQVNLNPIFSFKASTQPRILNTWTTHWMGASRKYLRQSLITGPIGILIPPSRKAIIGITTSPSHLIICHSPSLQYLKPTLLGILQSVMNFSIASSNLKKGEGKKGTGREETQKGESIGQRGEKTYKSEEELPGQDFYAERRRKFDWTLDT